MTEFQVEVFDRSNWRQVITLRKALVQVGSDPRNDVVLDPARGNGALPRHLQLLLAPGRAAPRLVNLGSAVTVAGAQGERDVAPNTVMDLAAGDRVRVGEFTLLIGRLAGAAVNGGPAMAVPAASPPAGAALAPGPAAIPVVARPAGIANLAVELKLPDTTLTTGRPLEGTLVVKNLGALAGVQLRIAVEGLPAECYEIGPAPILFPNAQKEVFFRLRHPSGPGLPAGRQRFRVAVTAPDSYPGETAAVLQALTVQSFHRHEVRLTPVE
jgi:hypothetical protein